APCTATEKEEDRDVRGDRSRDPRHYRRDGHYPSPVPFGKCKRARLPGHYAHRGTPAGNDNPAGRNPPGGVWVKVTYNGTYYGEYGNPGSLIEARGTGVQFYAIKNSNGLVQDTFRKMDYSGETLTVEVYNNGTMVTHISKSTPGGTIALLVDPVTGKAPYVPVTNASV